MESNRHQRRLQHRPVDGNGRDAHLTTGGDAEVLTGHWSVREGSTAIDVSPITFSLDTAANRQLDVQARLLESGQNGWHFASVTLTPDDGAIPTVVLPVVFFAADGVFGDLMYDNLELGNTSTWSSVVD